MSDEMADEGTFISHECLGGTANALRLIGFEWRSASLVQM